MPRIDRNVSISACLPVYNRGATLERALDSISNQTLPPKEIIICDFASSDNSREVIAKWINCNNDRFNIKYKKFEIPPEGVEDWNLTIENATGDFVAILEGDDAWPSSYLETAARKLDDNPSAGLLFFPGENEKGKSSWPVTGKLSDQEILNYFRKMQCFAAPSQAIFKRCGKNQQPFLYNDRDFHYAPEMDLYFRITLSGYSAIILDDLFVYRGIGKRKPVIPLYYQDHFNLQVRGVKEGNISRTSSLVIISRIFLFYFARILKRCFETDKMNKPSDLLHLTKIYFQKITSLFSQQLTD